MTKALLILLGLFAPMLAFAQSLNSSAEDQCFATGNSCDVYSGAQSNCAVAINVESCVCGAANLYGLACYNCQLAAGTNATDILTELAACVGTNVSVPIVSATSSASSAAATSSSTSVPSTSGSKTTSGSSGTSTASAHSGAGYVAVHLGLMGLFAVATVVIFAH